MARKKNKSEELDIAKLNVKNALLDIETEASIFLTDEPEAEGFLPEAEVTEEEVFATEVSSVDEIPANLARSELDNFESADIEDIEFVADEQAQSIIESILFASDRPVSFASIQLVFKGTNIKKDHIRRIIETLSIEYASGNRGIVLEEITGGYQLRTKFDNLNFIKRTVKTRAFKLSGPALETLSIVAYKQPVVKIEVDQIRGVESGHLLRALMEKGLVSFEGKAEALPGKPMQYGTTRRFLEIFGLRNLKELPTLSQIDELLPDGIGDEHEEQETLAMVTDSLAENGKSLSYSEGEEELGLIEQQLTAITTSSEFFEQEKLRQKQKRDEEKAQNIREALAVGEEVPKRDVNWLKRFETPVVTENEILAESKPEEKSEFVVANNEADDVDDEIADELDFIHEADETPEEGHA